MAKITVLFGAGAEGKGQFDLPTGASFKRDVILAKNAESFGNLFLKSSNYNLKLTGGTIIAHNATSVLYQTIVENNSSDCKILEKLFPDENDRCIAQKYIEYKRGLTKKENENKNGNEDEKETKSNRQISDNFRSLYKANFYDRIKDTSIDNLDDSLKYFLDNAGIYSFLDSLFNYLRKPELYNNECARVIKIYYAALLSILDGLAESLDVSEQGDLSGLYSNLKKGSNQIENSVNVLSDIIAEFQNAVVRKADVKSKTEQDKLYYFNIKELSKNNDVSCITTNYTNICQKIIDIDDEHFSYLHGKLELFEEHETKDIKNIKEVDLSKTVFPYLLIQSGVKPIISPLQIKEFSKACDMVVDADELLIIGYGVNSDDEHIKNILRERFKQNKKLNILFMVKIKMKEKKKKLELKNSR